ncbi:hypothetical protein EV363DRAFT_1219495 [Boletus edulis]|nr:hypothetical protein EV363DRAFT_1219495 [Boletus edulis]
MSWNAATSGCEFKVMSSLTRFPDVALPLPPRPIDAFVECTSVTIFFSLYENTSGSDERTHGFPLAHGLPMPLTISAKLFVDIVRSSCPFKSIASRSRKPSIAQVARSPPAVATTKLNCWPCQIYRSLAMTGWAGI